MFLSSRQNSRIFQPNAERGGGTRHGGRLGARSEHPPTGPATALSLGMKKSAALSKAQIHRLRRDRLDACAHLEWHPPARATAQAPRRRVAALPDLPRTEGERTVSARSQQLAAFYAQHAAGLERAAVGQLRVPPQVVEDACRTAWTILLRRPDLPLDRQGPRLASQGRRHHRLPRRPPARAARRRLPARTRDRRASRARRPGHAARRAGRRAA